MKNITLISTFLALFISTTIFAQDIPKKEFKVQVSEYNIQVSPGETKHVDVKILRSKAYNRTKIQLVMDSTLPEGISITFENGIDPLVNRIMIVEADANTQPFQKTLILKGKSSRVTKGIMLNMSLEAPQSLSVN